MRKLAFVSIWLLVFAIPWENIVFFPGIGTASRIFGFWAFIVGLTAILILKQEIRLHLLHWLVFYFVLWGGFSYFWSIDQELTLNRLWTYLQLLIMIWMIYQWVPETKALNALLSAYVLGAYVSAFSTVTNYLRGDMAHWQRYAALGFNPNDLAVILALGIPMAWYLLRIKWGGQLKWMFLFYPFLTPIVIALTGSRSGMIATLAALSFVLWTAPKLSTRIKLACLAAGWVTIWAGISFVPFESWGRLATTGNELIEGGWNSRLSIWQAGFEAFASNPLFGLGAGAFSSAVEPFLGVGKASHNVYLAILVEQGLVGFGLFALILATVLFSSLQMPSLERSFWLILLAIWGISAFAHPWEWRKQTWLLFALVVGHAVALASQRKTETLQSDQNTGPGPATASKKSPFKIPA